MGKRQRDWARKVRLKLRRLLEFRCKACGSNINLEFDCIKPLGNNHGKLEWSWRMSIYRKQYEENNLQLLCALCHSKKSAKEQMI